MEKQKAAPSGADATNQGIKRIAQMRTSIGWIGGIIGAVLLLLFSAQKEDASSALEKRLAAALSQLEGAGSVEVVIYHGEETEESAGVLPVFSVGGSRKQDAAPKGVLVLAQGADDMRVRLEIARAVQSVLGVPASNVEVLKKSD